MTALPELTIRETAFLAEVPTVSVEKAVETKVLRAAKRRAPRSGGEKRFLPVKAVAYLAALRESKLMDLSVHHKKVLWRAILSLGPTLGTVQFAPGATLALSELAADEFEKALRYIKARERYIVSDEKILGGTPIIAGTRIPVYSILARMKEGETLDELCEDNPDIPRDAIEAAAIYARSNPLRGRPSGRPWRDAA